jgi:hypothetical protein
MLPSSVIFTRVEIQNGRDKDSCFGRNDYTEIGSEFLTPDGLAAGVFTNIPLGV